MAAQMNPELAAAIVDVASRNDWKPTDLGTVISYETAGTFDPWKAGPRTQWGQHRGLIQWGEPQAKQYGVTPDMSVTDQMKAVEQYLKDRGLKPGADLLDMYSTINAGSPGRYNASDANNGGAPGTVLDKVRNQMGGHARNAQALLSGQAGMLTPSSAAPAPTATVPAPVASDTAPATLAPTLPPDDGSQLQASLQGIQKMLAQTSQAPAPLELSPLPAPAMTPAMIRARQLAQVMRSRQLTGSA